MAHFSNWAESGILNWLFRGNSSNFVRPLNISIALCSGIPAEEAQGNNMGELPNAGAYARANLGAPTDSIFTQITQDFGIHSSGHIDNVSAISFGPASANWGWVSGIAVMNSGVYGTGEIILRGQLVTPREILINDTFQFGVGDFDIYLG